MLINAAENLYFLKIKKIKLNNYEFYKQNIGRINDGTLSDDIRGTDFYE